MTKITDKTVKSKYPPKQTNVTWIDTSQKPAVTKSYIDGAWVIVGGGGGGTNKYSDLEEKPSINGVELDGNKTSNDIGVYSKPSGGIPESDLSSDVQQALQKHFKGWWPDLATLKAAHTATEGDSAYVKDASPATTWSIYVYDSTASSDNYWTDSGTDADTSNVQTFASGEEVNETYIDDTHLSNPTNSSVAKAADVVDTIENFIGYESTTEEVSELIPYVQHQGYFNSVGTITNTTGTTGTGVRRYSDPIFLKAGETLKIKAITPTDSGRYGIYNPDTQTISNVVMGASTSVTSGNEYETTYVATEDTWLVIGWYWGYFQMTLTKIYNKTTTSSKLDDIDEIEEVLEFEDASGTVTENIQLSITKGAFFNEGTNKPITIQTHSYYSYSAPFDFYKGDTITIVTKNCSSSAVLFAIKDGDWFRRKKNGNNGEQTFVYEADFDGQGEVSFKTSEGITVTRTYSKSGKSSERLDELESKITDITATTSALSESVDAIEESVIQVIDDDLTQDYIDGYYIKTDGTVKSDSDYGYKEFDVRAGCVIDFSTSYGHPSTAALAKKISNTSYEMLVQGANYAAQSFSYTAEEDMTIAVTFMLSSTRSIKLSTNFVNANSLGVTNLINDNKEQHDELVVQNINLGFLFNNIAVIGDSMSVATMDGYAGPLGASWLAFLAKRWNCQNEQWYAQGGTSAHQWLNSTTYGLKKMLDDTNTYNAYFVAYGHNDSASVGSASDTAATVTIGEGNVPSVQDNLTFCAYYKAIINQIREKSPHAMIFCLSQYDYLMAPGGDHASYGEAVIAIAQLYHSNGDNLVYSLETGGVPISNMRIGTHYSTIGYAYIASKVNEAVNKVIYENRAVEEIKNFGVYNL